jgi:hypothetical protein
MEVPMASQSFADQLREGYGQVAGWLSCEERALVEHARDPRGAGAAERNRLLAQVVCAYRSGPRALWGPAVLDLLAPTLVLILQGLRPIPHTVDESEIRQQLIAEALEAAATVRLLDGGAQTRFRITSRAYTRVLRWLAREGRRRRVQFSLDGHPKGRR